MQGGISFVRGCFSLLKVNPIQHNFELNLREARTGKSVSFDDIKNGYDPMLRRLVLLPPAKQNRELIFDILHRLDRKNPLVGYHESKMHDILAQIELATALVSGEQEPQKKGFDLYSKAMNAISLAVELVGNLPDKSVEVATIHRYGQLCYTIHRSFKAHRVSISNEHKQRMHKAVDLMEPVSDDPKVQELQAKLVRTLNEM